MAGEGANRASIATQAVRGSLYSVSASLVTLCLGFGRSILLARLLLPEHFGVVALALFYIGLASRLRGLGLDAALIHRQGEEGQVLPTYFALRMGPDLVVSGLLLAATPLLGRAYPQMQNLGAILPLLVLAYLLSNLSQVQETLLRKDLAFSALSCTDVVASLVMTVAAPYLAWRGWGVWALVAEQISGIGTRFVLTWGPFRRWRPQLGWDKTVARWFWAYGKPSWAATNLGYLLDRFDDFWIGSALGGAALGFYARAYEFAHYPRRVFANPLVTVLGPVFARLQDDRLRLSQAFYRSAHFTLRTGMLIAGAFALVMPEFIHFVIGDKWLPMLWTFRLMLVYTVLDPLLLLMGSLLLAVGRPGEVRQAYVVQALFFVPSTVVGATLWGIDGVAVAADAMLALGAWRFCRSLRHVVDFSLSRLVLRPALALTIAWGSAFLLEAAVAWAPPAMVLAKLGLFAALFSGFLLWAERGDYLQGLRWLRQVLRFRGAQT